MTGKDGMTESHQFYVRPYEEAAAESSDWDGLTRETKAKRLRDKVLSNHTKYGRPTEDRADTEKKELSYWTGLIERIERSR